MRGLVTLVSIVGVVVIMIGVFAILPREQRPPANPVAEIATKSAVARETTSPSTGAVQGTTPAGAVVPVSLPQLPAVNKPQLVSPISPLGLVEQYYSETQTFGAVTVAWRPGAFDPAIASSVAEMAQRGINNVSAFLNIHDDSPLTVFLADEMFDENCRGCQGFAASDLHQIFILQDGSVAADEMQGLITHEVAHVIAGNHIGLPNSLFFAEGFATYQMDADVQAAGYVPAIQAAAWAYQAGILPTLAFLRDEATYEGRVRRRLEYDAAGSFSQFLIEKYGLEAYTELYRTRVPEQVLGVDWQQLEEQWHAYLEPLAGNIVNGVDGASWWNVAQNVAAGFGALYDAPDKVSVESYAALTAARLALYRLDLPNAIRFANESNLAPKTAT
ncbi:MAG TPA: hypothetical protein PK593_11440 [Thermomicrobiales bacterium]|nr:hypothetical protein [Chloroflexota bacterium]HQX64059.1 hypothetical protein [Thermomicrobiales bacterium]HQZ88461.1 hypothetical protein [Thermomicrobiales bacterium]